MRVAHVITGLETGGAEMLLARLLERLDHDEVDSTVISLRREGPVAARIEALGVSVQALNMRPRPLPTDLARLRRAIRDARPEVVQTWLLHANVLAGVIARLAGRGANGRVPVVWGVHISVVDPAVHGRTAAITRRAERALAGTVPTRIVACSQSAFDTMRALRYPDAKLELIPNGFDLERFRPDAATRTAVRAELGMAEDALIVGHVARFHPMKDHRTLLAAAESVIARVPDAHFVLAGSDVTPQNPELSGWAASLGDRAHMLGERRDVGRLYRAFDIAASSSASGEALPLVIGEAMACEVPMVVTRCGDAAALVGDTGRVVPVRDPAALADAIVELLELPRGERESLGAAARRRIGQHYDLDEMVARYVGVWRQALESETSKVP